NCEYIKENGIWKIRTMRFDQLYDATPAQGWVDPDLVAPPDPQVTYPCQPDIPRTISYRYPSGYIVPFHYKHPVTGKKTTEEARNLSLKGASDA
ncbi:MAG: hypothetical protein JXA46_16860, partial [Dehalococcoidales bacterium]|nr:hypothetical protein [Dehalococcoidales bacterium]